MVNYNHLLGKVPVADGVKAGYIVDAGYNLAASAKRRGKRTVVVVLGSRTATSLDACVASLLELGFASAVPLQVSPHSASVAKRLRS